MVGAKAGRHSHHLFEAQTKKSRTCEQDKGKGNLRDDEAVAKTLRGATGPPTAGFGLERVCQMTAQVEPRDRDRDCDSEKD
ncbi:hypothetical protein D3C83_175530 [compost metagenome]